MTKVWIIKAGDDGLPSRGDVIEVSEEEAAALRIRRTFSTQRDALAWKKLVAS